MHLKEAVFCLLLAAIMPALGIQDIVVQINTMRWSQVVSDRFLSMSIDPLAIILAGKLGPAAIHMAKGLSPIFVRIGGPNTENVRFGNSPSSRNNISVTEEEWVAVNRFAQEARLDIVLCLRAMRRTQTVWDSANALEIISTSHKHGFTDIWQMGWDMSEMTGIGGAELGRDIVRLKKILDAFPGYEHTPILAPGLSCCMNHFQTRFIKDLLQESSTAVSALPVHLNFSGVSLDKVAETIGTTLGQMEEQIWSKDLLLRTTIPRKPIWISELEPNSGDFKDAIKWIVKLGSAARFGVQVMMRQPHLLSFHSPTHDYWASLLYKNLVGRFVFDSRLLSGNRSSTFIYSHCTHPTNDELTILSSKWNYEKGALTVFGVNPSSESIKVAVRGLIMKEEPVHLYVLTEENSDSSKDNSKWHPTNTLFNGQKLILSPKGELPLLTPKERRVSRGQSIPIPPQSIFFMVLPDVKLRLCMSNPFTTDEFQDLGKKLTSPLLLSEDVIDSWEDSNADRVYVSFSKRVPAPHKPHTPQEDLKSKLLKDWHKVAGKLGIEKEFHETDLENVKYNFYNDQSWLSRLAEGLKKDPEETNSEQKKSENDSDLSRLEKYDLLTSAIYGKENNGTNLFQLSGNNYESVDPYHYRYVRDAELSDKKNNNNEVKLLNNENSDKLHTESNKDMNKEILDDLLVTENHKDIHDYVVNYMKQGGHKIDSNIVNPPEGVHPLHTFMKDLEHVDVTVGQSVDHKHDKSFFDSEESQKSITFEHTSDKNTENGHQIVKRSRSNSGYENSQNYNYDQETDAFLPNQNERKNIAKLENDDQEVETDFDNVSSFVNKNNEFSALSTEKKNDIRQIINENMEKHAAFEIAPEPELVGMEDMSISSSPSTSLVEKNMSDQTSDGYQENTEITPDFQSGNLEKIDRINLEEVSEDGASRSNIEENGLKEGISAPENLDNVQSMNSGNNNGEKSDFVNEEKKSEVKENEKPIEVEKNDPVYPEETLKEPPKFRSFSEIIEQLKTKGVKEFGQTNSYRSAKIEERIQKLESFKSRVSEIKDKIKEELNKAHEKLAQSLESIKSNGEYEQPTKRNIYDVPDKLAGLLEKLNFNYMSNVKPNSRYSRSPLLSDDEIDEILERELAETANEFYHEQMLGLDDEDFTNKRDQSNMHYLVPAVPGTHNVLFDREVFPAKIYNMVKGEHIDLDLDEKLDNDEHLEFKNRFDMRNMIPNLQNRMNYERNHIRDRNNYDMDNLGSMLSENDYDESMRNMFDPLEFNMYRNNFLRRNRKYRPNMLNRFARYNDNDELARFLYTRNMLGDNRFRRSTKLPSSNEVFREKRHVNYEDIDRNLIKKNPTKKEFETDDLKIQVDKKFKNEKTSLHKLAEEYTKLDKDKNSKIPSSSHHSVEDNTELDESVTNQISEIPSDSSSSNQLTNENQINDFDKSHFNKPIFENMNQIITDSENALSKGVDIINDIKINELLEDSNDSLKNIMSEPVPDDKEESDYSEIDYPEDWTNKAERVSPPIQKSKSDKRKNNTSDHHHSSTLGRLIGKIKHIIKFISEFGISDYIKGKRKNSQNSA